jgi:hypothetical protein
MSDQTLEATEAPAEQSLDNFEPFSATYDNAVDAPDDMFALFSTEGFAVNEETQDQAQEEAPVEPVQQAEPQQQPQEPQDDPYLTLAEQLRQNPALTAQVVQSMLQAQYGQQGAPQQEEVEEAAEEDPLPEILPRPSRPVRPEGYSEEEALTDPTSPSGRYFLSLQQYAVDMADYNASVDERNMAIEERRQAEMDAQRQYQEQVQQLARVANEVIEMGATKDEAKAFLTWANSPSYDVKTLYQFYQYINGGRVQQQGQPSPQRPMQQQQVVQQKAEEMRRLAQRPSIPTPSTAAPGEPAQRDPVDVLFQGVLSEYNRTNPF